MLDYTDTFDAFLLVAEALLGHAGSIQVFKDENGMLCVRTSLTESRGPGIKHGRIVHEPIGKNERPEHPNHIEDSI